MKPSDLLRYLYWLLAAVLPWSTELPLIPGGQAKIMLPAEAVIGIISILLCRFVRPAAVLKSHKIVLYAVICLGWGWICTLTSVAPVVSVKYMIITTACCWVFFIPAIKWPFILNEMLPVFAVSIGLAAIRVMILHGVVYHFRYDQANLPAMPFFDDQNLIGAILAMLVFLIWVSRPATPFWQPARWVLCGIFLTGILFSGSRGAWISVIGSWTITVLFLLFQRSPFLGFLTFSVLLTGALWLFSNPALGKKIHDDVSIMERFNRYQCAWSMANEKPVTGFGPGTYAFAYFPYQKPENATRISLNKPITERGPDNYGYGGGAHSEYFQTMAETGWAGLLLLCLFWGIILKKSLAGIKFDRHQLSAVLIIAGLSTFLIHGIFNNFFHDPRIAFLVWTGIGNLYASEEP